MVLRGLNKRGQDLPIGTLILLVIGVIVLILVVIGFTAGWDFILDKFKIAPGQNLQALASSCTFAAQQGLKIDYCSFKKVSIDGKSQYVNCVDTRIEEAIREDISGSDIGDCAANYAWEQYCRDQKLKEGALVNGKECPKPNTEAGSNIPGTDLPVSDTAR